MKRKMLSLRTRITLLSMGLLALCCVVLTFALNLSAFRMTESFSALTIASTVTPEQTYPAIDLEAPVMEAVPVEAARADFRQESVLYMVLIVAGGGLLVYLFTGRALRPLEQLADAMQQRTVQNLAQELPVPSGQDEVAQLTEAFNQMSRTLAQAFENQRRFAQNAAHELRTPLAVMQTRIEVFGMKPERTRQEYDSLLETVASNTHRLSLTVQDLLQLADMQSPACTERVELDTLARDVASQLSAPAQAAGVQVECTGDSCTVQGSRRLLESALYNLVENAIRYNHPGGAVTVRLLRQEDDCIVQVEDTGPGIPTEAQSRIFEPFYRVDKSRSRALGGAGLGLALVREIAQLHGGTVEVESAPGQGSVFRLRLPCAGTQS